MNSERTNERLKHTKKKVTMTECIFIPAASCSHRNYNVATLNVDIFLYFFLGSLCVSKVLLDWLHCFFVVFFLFFFLSLSPSKHPILLYCLYFVFPYENSLNSLVYFTIFIAIIFIVFVCLYYFIKNFSYIFCFRFILCVCLKFCAATPTFAILFLQWSILRALWYVRSLLWCCHLTNKRDNNNNNEKIASCCNRLDVYRFYIADSFLSMT